MRTVWNAAAAMDTDKRLYRSIKINGINGAGLSTLTAADAELLSYDNASSFSLGIGAGRAGLSTRGRVACETGSCFKPC